MKSLLLLAIRFEPTTSQWCYLHKGQHAALPTWPLWIDISAEVHNCCYCKRQGSNLTAIGNPGVSAKISNGIVKGNII